jgi:hypothetical protein
VLGWGWVYEEAAGEAGLKTGVVGGLHSCGEDMDTISFGRVHGSG